MTMKDIVVVCDVVMDPAFEIMVFADIAFILLLLGIAIGVIVYVIIKLVKLIKSNNSNTDNVENEQSAPAEQEDDTEQLK